MRLIRYSVVPIAIDCHSWCCLVGRLVVGRYFVNRG